MKLEDIFELEEIKIADACLFIPTNVIRFIKEQRNIFETDKAKLRVLADVEKRRYELLSNNYFFTNREVIKEIKKGVIALDSEINGLLSYCRNRKDESNKSRKEIIDLIIEIRDYKNLIHELSSRRVFDLCYEKSEEYKKLSKDIITISMLWHLKGMSLSDNKEDLHTDEKIIALALALVEKNKVLVITSDNHLVWIRNYMRDKGFDALSTKYNIKDAIEYRQRALKIKVYHTSDGIDYELRE